MDLQQRRDLNNGFGETLAKAFELVLTPLIFGLLGRFVDNRLHTRPLFMLVFGLGTFGYVAWRAVRGYGDAMAVQEERIGLGRDRSERDV